MALQTLDITYDKIEFQVIGEYHKGYQSSSYLNEYEPAQFEISSIKIAGFEVYDVLDHFIICVLAEKALEACQ